MVVAFAGSLIGSVEPYLIKTIPSSKGSRQKKAPPCWVRGFKIKPFGEIRLTTDWGKAVKVLSPNSSQSCCRASKRFRAQEKPALGARSSAHFATGRNAWHSSKN